MSRLGLQCPPRPQFNPQFNKHFHIWAGRFAYLAGVVQCYYGLELVAGSDNLVISVGDGLDLEVHLSLEVCSESMGKLSFVQASRTFNSM